MKKFMFCYMLLVSGIIGNLNAQEYTIEIYATFNRGSGSNSSGCSNFCKVTAVLQNNTEKELWNYNLGGIPKSTTWSTTRKNAFQYNNKIVKLKVETRRTWSNISGCNNGDAYKGYCEIPFSFSGGTYEKSYSSSYKDSQGRNLYEGYSGNFTVKIYPANITLKYENDLSSDLNILPDKHKIKIKAKETYPSGSFKWEYQTGSIQQVKDKWVPDYIPNPNYYPNSYGYDNERCIPYDYTKDNCAHCQSEEYSSFHGDCYEEGGFWLYKSEFVGDAWQTISSGNGKSEISICGNDLMSDFVEKIVKTKKQVRIRINYSYKQSEIIVLDGKKSSPTIISYVVTRNSCKGESNASIQLKFSDALLSSESLSIGVNNVFKESYANITSLGSDNSYTINGLAAGEYVFDLLGKYPYSSNPSLNIYATFTGAEKHKCTVTVQDPPKLTFTGGTSSDVSCHEGNDGKIPVNIGGGTSPYKIYYSHNGNAEVSTDIAGTGTYTLSGLIAGNYTVRLVDNKNCEPKNDNQNVITVTKTISQPANPLKFNSVNSKTPTGYGLTNGEISVSATGGTGSYTYEWKKDGATFTPSQPDKATNLGKGTYSVTVKDSKYDNASTGGESNCKACYDVYSLELTEPDILEVTTELNSAIKCNGDANGSLKITVKGGVSPYQKYKLITNGNTGSEQAFPSSVII
ncbi:MAG: SprB repeat-containing protein [Prevotellaceae bacterium]|jgi:hypothetical protein|nr:SprB repeat-containing protein [Prevotellaceae bacterium]